MLRLWGSTLDIIDMSTVVGVWLPPIDCHAVMAFIAVSLLHRHVNRHAMFLLLGIGDGHLIASPIETPRFAASAAILNYNAFTRRAVTRASSRSATRYAIQMLRSSCLPKLSLCITLIATLHKFSTNHAIYPPIRYYCCFYTTRAPGRDDTNMFPFAHAIMVKSDLRAPAIRAVTCCIALIP